MGKSTTVYVVSLRAPYNTTINDGRLVYTQNMGGVATIFCSLGEKSSSDLQVVNIGYAGDVPADHQEQVERYLRDKHVVPVFIPHETYVSYYYGEANRYLWPISHERNGRKIYEEVPSTSESFGAYKEANEIFFEKIAGVLRKARDPDEEIKILVNDYQLYLLPKMIKDRFPEVDVSFFSHIPWPQPEVFERMDGATRKEYLQGIAAADRMGWHVEEYCDDFITCCERNLPGDDVVQIRQKTAASPIGITPESCSQDHVHNDPETNRLTCDIPGIDKVLQLKEKFPGLKIVASADRMDPSKGIPERLAIIREYFKTYPKDVGQVTFAMLLPASRSEIPAYSQLSEQAQLGIERINGEFSGQGQPPVIKPMPKGVPLAGVVTLYQHSNVHLSTSFPREGFHLGAFEAVAANEHTGNPIVCVGSVHTGAAKSPFKEHMLGIDPANTHESVETLHRAIHMSAEEAGRLYKGALDYVKKHTALEWAKRVIYGSETMVTEKMTGEMVRYVKDVVTELENGPPTSIIGSAGFFGVRSSEASPGGSVCPHP